MMDVVKVVEHLILPLVDDKESVSVKQLESLDDEILVMIYAKSNDIARLIGRRGSLAGVIRQTMQIPSRLLNKRINIKFEAI